MCVDAGSALHAPDSLSDHEAAGLMEATLTAYLNIFEVGRAQPGQLVLIHGGGSGVGTQARRPSRTQPDLPALPCAWCHCLGHHTQDHTTGMEAPHDRHFCCRRCHCARPRA